MKPDFPTSFDFGTASDKTGFDGFFEEPVKDIYKAPDSHASWHNLYKKRSVKNKNVDHGKILLVCDSYSN